MDYMHDDTNRDEGMVYVGRFGDAELTDEEYDTLQTAFTALVRSGRPLFGAVPEDGGGRVDRPRRSRPEYTGERDPRRAPLPLYRRARPHGADRQPRRRPASAAP